MKCQIFVFNFIGRCRYEIDPQAARRAITLALASVSAHAALAPPTQTLASPPTTQTGLYLAVYDSAGNNSEIVNLSYDQSAITAASGALTPNSATSPFVSTTAPTGTGNVLQLNFGQISGFGSLFTSANAATTNFMVIDGISGSAGNEQFQATSASRRSRRTAVWEPSSAASRLNRRLAGFCPNSGDVKDTTARKRTR